jgi:hypothetical protein
MIAFDSNEAGGGALAVGSLVVLLVLHRTPESVLAAATTGPRPALYFVALPALGLLAGGYAAIGGPYAAVPLFALGSYLGVFGLGLALGSLLAPPPAGGLLATGLVLLSLAVVALVSSIRRSAAVVRFDALGPVDP